MMARAVKTGMTFFVWPLLLWLLASCTTVAVQDPVGIVAESPNSDDYPLGPDDVIEVLVWKNPDLSKVVTVRPDGKISLPLVGDVPAAGLTPSQVKDQILEKLKEFYKDPAHISVIVQQANSYVIYILGEVKNPAQYVVKRGTTFLQAIALAGGFTPFASTNDILVLRNENNNHSQTQIKIRYKGIISGNLPSSNIILKPGDTIVVP